MTWPLSVASRDLEAMIDGAADFMAGLLRRVAAEMADGVDRAARLDIEGVSEWRNILAKGRSQ